MKKPTKRMRAGVLRGCLALVLGMQPLAAQSAAPRDGQRDFDWEIGAWSTRLRRLVRPLSGSTEWVEYEGTTVVREVWQGNANLVELDVTGPPGRIQALSLRLYDPEQSVRLLTSWEALDVSEAARRQAEAERQQLAEALRQSEVDRQRLRQELEELRRRLGEGP